MTRDRTRPAPSKGAGLVAHQGSGLSILLLGQGLCKLHRAQLPVRYRRRPYRVLPHLRISGGELTPVVLTHGTHDA